VRRSASLNIVIHQVDNVGKAQFQSLHFILNTVCILNMYDSNEYY